MGLFSPWDSLPPGPERQPKKGLARYLGLLWDNLGKLLLINLLCFAGFLPLALLVSLGIVFENFWISVLGGLLGGAVAGPVWTATLSLCFLCLQTAPYQWFAFWRRVIREKGMASAASGAFLGGVFAAILHVGSFALGLVQQGLLPALWVWLMLGVDFFAWALGVSALFGLNCFEKPSAAGILALARRIPGRLTACALVTEAAVLTVVALFPTSVPYVLVLGFPFPMLLAQLLAPGLEGEHPHAFAKTVLAADQSSRSRQKKSAAFFQKYRIPVLAALFLCAAGLSFWQVQLRVREPDIQIAVIHREALPDSVRAALEQSLASAVGDRNGDGAAVATVNDYTVVFDGSAQSADAQTAGMTQLVTDLSGQVSDLYLAEDAEAFSRWYGDQVLAAGLFRDCPGLTALDAGTYSTLLEIHENRSGSALLLEYGVFPARWAEESLILPFLQDDGVVAKATLQ